MRLINYRTPSSGSLPVAMVLLGSVACGNSAAGSDGGIATDGQAHHHDGTVLADAADPPAHGALTLQVYDYNGELPHPADWTVVVQAPAGQERETAQLDAAGRAEISVYAGDSVTVGTSNLVSPHRQLYTFLGVEPGDALVAGAPYRAPSANVVLVTTPNAGSFSKVRSTCHQPFSNAPTLRVVPECDRGDGKMDVITVGYNTQGLAAAYAHTVADIGASAVTTAALAVPASGVPVSVPAYAGTAVTVDLSIRLSSALTYDAFGFYTYSATSLTVQLPDEGTQLLESFEVGGGLTGRRTLTVAPRASVQSLPFTDDDLLDAFRTPTTTTSDMCSGVAQWTAGPRHDVEGLLLDVSWTQGLTGGNWWIMAPPGTSVVPPPLPGVFVDSKPVGACQETFGGLQFSTLSNYRAFRNAIPLDLHHHDALPDGLPEGTYRLQWTGVAPP